MLGAFRYFECDSNDRRHRSRFYRPPVCGAGYAHKSQWRRGRFYEYMDTVGLRLGDLDRLRILISRPR